MCPLKYWKIQYVMHVNVDLRGDVLHNFVPSVLSARAECVTAKLYCTILFVLNL